MGLNRKTFTYQLLSSMKKALNNFKCSSRALLRNRGEANAFPIFHSKDATRATCTRMSDFFQRPRVPPRSLRLATQLHWVSAVAAAEVLPRQIAGGQCYCYCIPGGQTIWADGIVMYLRQQGVDVTSDWFNFAANEASWRKLETDYVLL